jgi:hypothetical protein
MTTLIGAVRSGIKILVGIPKCAGSLGWYRYC